jgi:hypothetical protein
VRSSAGCGMCCRDVMSETSCCLQWSCQRRSDPRSVVTAHCNHTALFSVLVVNSAKRRFYTQYIADSRQQQGSSKPIIQGLKHASEPSIAPETLCVKHHSDSSNTRFMLLALGNSRRTRRASNRLPPHLTDRPKANQWVIPRHSLQSAAMAVDALGLGRGRHSDGAAEGRGRGDGAGACWGLGASRESCCSGEGYWVGRADLRIELGGEENNGKRGLMYHHAVDAGGGCGERAAVAVYAGVNGAAACGRAAASLLGNESGAVG